MGKEIPDGCGFAIGAFAAGGFESLRAVFPMICTETTGVLELLRGFVAMLALIGSAMGVGALDPPRGFVRVFGSVTLIEARAFELLRGFVEELELLDNAWEGIDEEGVVVCVRFSAIIFSICFSCSRSFLFASSACCHFSWAAANSLFVD